VNTFNEEWKPSPLGSNGRFFEAGEEKEGNYLKM